MSEEKSKNDEIDYGDGAVVDVKTGEIVKAEPPAVAVPAEKPKTAQELRVIEVNEALLPAYQKASTLELTDDEIEALQEPFADMDVEIRPHDGLIYIPHILISDRLNHVLKPGKWALVCRRNWHEPGVLKDGAMTGGVMYGEYVLLIRGCYVGESIGGHPYIANNPKVNYSDALESTAGEALRRICGKRLSCGSQVWNPEYSRKWVSKYAKQGADRKWYKSKTEMTIEDACGETPKFTPRKKPVNDKSIEAGVVVGILESVHIKDGKNARGNSWKRYGIKIGDEFYGTFDNSLGAEAEKLKGKEVIINYTKDQQGFLNIVTLGSNVSTPEIEVPNE
jgi:hypothetical protein